jgi:taurine dioxygenase
MAAMTTTTTFTVTPRAGHLGVDVTGLDLRDVPGDDALTRTVTGLLDEHLVVFFRGQELDDDAQLAFALALGEPYVHPIARAGGATRATCEHIVDDVEHPPFQDRWHTDVSWDFEPPVYGTLRAIDLPPKGGDTIWASMYAAHDALSPVMQQLLEPLQALHTMGASRSFLSKAGPEMVARTLEAFPGAVHPVIGTHPATGRRFLNVNAEFTQSIVGLEPEESDALLGFLVRHATQPNFQVRHTWGPGDVGVWDERCTQHFAVADYMPARREMGRVAVV